MIVRTVLSVTCLLVTYAAAYVILSGKGDFPRADTAVLWTIVFLAGPTAALVWPRGQAWRAANLACLSLLGGLYAFEGYRLVSRGPLSGPGRPTHISEHVEFVRQSLRRGEPLVFALAPFMYMLNPSPVAEIPGHGKIVPLAGAARVKTVMCREGDRPFIVYTSDEYGFNNPPGLWQAPTQVVFVGDSFTYGACVANDDHFVQTIRARYPRTINLGYGGNGPLIELALIREYATKLRPSFVFWMYDESNDVYSINDGAKSDLESELDHPIVKRYLESETFSQELHGRRHDVDRAVAAAVAEHGKRLLDTGDPWTRFLSAAETRAMLRNAALPRPLRAFVASALPPTASRADDVVSAFQKIIRQAASEVVRGSGGRLVFVNLPSLPTICEGRAFPLKPRVLSAVRDAGLDIIDLEKDFRDAVAHRGTAPWFGIPPCGGHYSEAGYGLVRRRLLEFLDLATGELRLPPRGWVVHLGPPRRLVYEGTERSEQ